MSIKRNGKFYCGYCDKEWPTSQKADFCWERHDLILIPFLREDLSRLIQFLYLKNSDLLTESLVRTLNKYNKIKVKQPESGNIE
jgi:hypothetical protein